MDTLVEIALEAFRNAADNDGTVPEDDRDAAAEMIEQGVFGSNSEDFVDEYGNPLPEYIEAVKEARRQL